LAAVAVAEPDLCDGLVFCLAGIVDADVDGAVQVEPFEVGKFEACPE
jgi:hypothetical protein